MKNNKSSLPDYLLAAIFGATILIVAAQVIFRYVFNNSLTWVEELARYLFIWMIFLGAALALRDETHIRIDLLINRLPVRISSILKAVNLILTIVFIELAIVLGFILVGRTANTQSPALSLPVNYVYYASLPTAFLLGLYYESKKAMRLIRRKNNGEDVDCVR